MKNISEIKTKIVKTVIVMSVISVILNMFGCSAGKNETITLEGNIFTVLHEGKETFYKTKKGESEALFIFTAPAAGVYTVWNKSDDYAFCRVYNAPTLDWQIYADCQTAPFVKSFPLEAGESVYIGSINFSSDKGYEGIITVDKRENAPEPYENYGFPIEINAGDVIPFSFKHNYTPVVYEFTVPQNGTYLFYTDSGETAMPYLNIYSEPWCSPESFLKNIDHIEIPNGNYYTVENLNFSEAIQLKEGEVIFLALSVRAENAKGNFHIKLLEK